MSRGLGYLASLAVAGSFAIALGASVPFFSGGSHGTHIVLWDWMPSVGASFEITWDPLAALMTLVVTGVGSLIHIYAIGYMHGDPRFSRFFTYLNLFAASMLILVLAGNFAMLFLGWELVGLCSYLLDFLLVHASRLAAAAGKKAFIVNRIGDLGFLVGLMLIFASFHTLSFTGIFERAEELLSPGMATAIGLLMLVGAAGKSAQIPLYVWLPDAMEGPTPVSALIHAATMVTAGVYVIARSAAIFEISPIAGPVVATIGAVTALWAATIAIAQTDIKRVLAYSTISQLGYMFLAVGAAGYVAGVFHLMTHAFFKALLFLGAGSVIHGMRDQQDMRKMGGLRKAMPVTAATMAIATVAIAGIPPLAGLLVQGRDPGRRLRKGRLVQRPVGGRPGYCPAHRLLHDPPVRAGVHGGTALGSRRPSPRVAAGDDPALDRPGRAVDRRRFRQHPVPAGSRAFPGAVLRGCADVTSPRGLGHVCPPRRAQRRCRSGRGRWPPFWPTTARPNCGDDSRPRSEECGRPGRTPTGSTTSTA